MYVPDMYPNTRLEFSLKNALNVNQYDINSDVNRLNDIAFNKALNGQ